MTFKGKGPGAYKRSATAEAALNTNAAIEDLDSGEPQFELKGPPPLYPEIAFFPQPSQECKDAARAGRPDLVRMHRIRFQNRGTSMWINTEPKGQAVLRYSQLKLLGKLPKADKQGEPQKRSLAEVVKEWEAQDVGIGCIPRELLVRGETSSSSTTSKRKIGEVEVDLDKLMSAEKSDKDSDVDGRIADRGIDKTNPDVCSEVDELEVVEEEDEDDYGLRYTENDEEDDDGGNDEGGTY